MDEKRLHEVEAENERLDWPSRYVPELISDVREARALVRRLVAELKVYGNPEYDPIHGCETDRSEKRRAALHDAREAMKGWAE